VFGRARRKSTWTPCSSCRRAALRRRRHPRHHLPRRPRLLLPLHRRLRSPRLRPRLLPRLRPLLRPLARRPHLHLRRRREPCPRLPLRRRLWLRLRTRSRLRTSSPPRTRLPLSTRRARLQTVARSLVRSVPETDTGPRARNCARPRARRASCSSPRPELSRSCLAEPNAGASSRLTPSRAEPRRAESTGEADPRSLVPRMRPIGQRMVGGTTWRRRNAAYVRRRCPTGRARTARRPCSGEGSRSSRCSRCSPWPRGAWVCGGGGRPGSDYL
jgi:hypothetical protein